MYVFMIVFLPLVSFAYFSIFTKNKTQFSRLDPAKPQFDTIEPRLNSTDSLNTSSILPLTKDAYRLFFLGVVLACFYAFIEVLSIQSLTYRHIRDSFILNDLLVFVLYYLLPTAVMFLLVFFCSRKSLAQKVSMMFPFMLGFYSIYMVYFSLLRYEKTSAFFMFVNPFLVFFYIFMFFYGFEKVLKSYDGLKNQELSKVKFALSIVLCVVSCVFPSLIQALYVVGVLCELRIILAMLYAGFVSFCMANLVLGKSLGKFF